MAEIDWKSQYEIERQAKEAACAEVDEAMRFNDSLRFQLAAANKALGEARAWTKEDKPLPEDADIHEAHPAKSGGHEQYEEAVRLVSAKRSKYALVGVVNWLLGRATKAEATLAAVTKERDELADIVGAMKAADALK